MDNKEISAQLNMSYVELVNYLIKKHGKAEHDYFLNESCKSKNPKISRSSEGLICHHIDEDKAIMLSNDKYAINNPYEYQRADRLVYCNLLEHLILHIKIVEAPRHKKSNPKEAQGIGGAVNWLCPQINDYYNGYKFKQAHIIKQNEVLEDNFSGYIKILKYFLQQVIDKDEFYALFVTKKRLSFGWDKQVVQKVYREIADVQMKNDIDSLLNEKV